MRRLGSLVMWAVMACSPAPPEPLREPRALPHQCKTPAQLSAVEQPILTASKTRRDAVLAAFLADHQLALTGQRTHAMRPTTNVESLDRDSEIPDLGYVYRAVEKAVEAHGTEPWLVVDLRRTAWSQVIIDSAAIEHHPCGDSLPISYELARDPNGATVVVRTHTSRHVVTIGEQCGECIVGCGMPVHSVAWAAVILPIATGEAVRILNLDLVEDEIRVRCEREVQAM